MNSSLRAGLAVSDAGCGLSAAGAVSSVHSGLGCSRAQPRPGAAEARRRLLHAVLRLLRRPLLPLLHRLTGARDGVLTEGAGHARQNRLTTWCGHSGVAERKRVMGCRVYVVTLYEHTRQLTMHEARL